MTMTQRLRRTCAGCGQVFPVRRSEDEHLWFGDQYSWYCNRRLLEGKPVFVHWTTNPFAAEIHDDYSLMWLCDVCEYQSAMDI